MHWTTLRSCPSCRQELVEVELGGHDIASEEEDSLDAVLEEQKKDLALWSSVRHKMGNARVCLRALSSTACISMIRSSFQLVGVEDDEGVLSVGDRPNGVLLES